MRNFLIIVLIFLCLSGFSQEEKTGIWKYAEPVLNVGFNMSKLETDSVEIENGNLPFVGLSLKREMSGIFNIIGISYSPKSSKGIDPFSKYIFHFLDAKVISQYNLSENIRFESGFQASFLLSALFQDGASPDNKVQIPIEKYKREFEALAGIQFRIQNDVMLGFRYYYPLNEVSFKNVQLYLSIPIRQDLFGPKVNKEEYHAGRQIEELKEGALLVRLKTYNNVIESLEKDGRTEEAENLRKKQELVNLEIILAFRKYYKFSDVYFFFSYYSEQVAAGHLKNIFVNDHLQPDSSIHCTNSNYYVAEINTLQADDVGQTSTGIEALILYDSNFVQLKRPFPFYVKRDEFFMGARSIAEMVGILNFNLYEFYKSEFSKK